MIILSRLRNYIKIRIVSPFINLSKGMEISVKNSIFSSTTILWRLKEERNENL